MKERRSPLSRAFRTAIPTLLACAAVLLVIAVASFADAKPQESAIVWLQFFVIAVFLAAPALIIRNIMLRRRGTGPKTQPPPPSSSQSRR
jgi:hypothetical protein